MNIYFSSSASYALSVLKEKIVPALTAQQKKILVIASILFGLMAACYVVSRCFTAKPKPDKKNPPPEVLLPKKNPQDTVPPEVEKSYDPAKKETVSPPPSPRESKSKFPATETPLLPETGQQIEKKFSKEPETKEEAKEQKPETPSTPTPETQTQPQPPLSPQVQEQHQPPVHNEGRVYASLKYETEQELVDEIISRDSGVRSENYPIYHNWAFVEPRFLAKTEAEAEAIIQKLLKEISFVEAQEIYQSYKDDKQKFLKILFYSIQPSLICQMQYFSSLLKLLRACHKADPIPNFMLIDFRRRLLDQSGSDCPEVVEVMFQEYFDKMTAEDFEDARLLYPLPAPLRVVPMLIDPTPLLGQKSNVVRVVGEGTNVEITEYVLPRDVRLQKLFNTLYCQAEEKFRSTR